MLEARLRREPVKQLAARARGGWPHGSGRYEEGARGSRWRIPNGMLRGAMASYRLQENSFGMNFRWCLKLLP